MQTLISAFKDSAAAHKARQRLVEAGFGREDIHIQEAKAPSGDEDFREIGDKTMDSGEREVAVDRHALEGRRSKRSGGTQETADPPGSAGYAISVGTPRTPWKIPQIRWFNPHRGGPCFL